MLDIGPSEQILDGEFVDLGEPVPVVPVPIIQAVRRSPTASVRPDPTFVTQLIATADQAPQTRRLRRGSLADAQIAYGASQIRPHDTGLRTRQTI